MKPGYMFSEENPMNVIEETERARWRQTRGELLGFAAFLQKHDGNITASQILVAVHFADKYLAGTIIVDTPYGPISDSPIIGG